MEMTETGKVVYERTYSRTKPDGSKEGWPETVRRVVDGNLGLVDSRYHLPTEREDLVEMIENLEILPAGRHLWASGVPGRQFLFNCHVAGWGKTSQHYDFAFSRLMEGGGVGASYSNSRISDAPIRWALSVEIVCDESHADYQTLKDAGLLSDLYSPDWGGAFMVDDSREGWTEALVDLIDTFYRKDTINYRRVYDVSNVRPAGARLKRFGGTASGPGALAEMMIGVAGIFSALAGGPLDGISAMEIDHEIAKCVVVGGVRRAARMSMMHWQDPQILRFINIKEETQSHWTTNISVEVDDGFWEALRNKESHATEVWKLMTEGMLRNGEPGLWDSELSNRDEPNEVVCTNPCGEINLEPWEPCNLGHVNLAAMVNYYGFDLRKSTKAHTLMTRFLIRATYGDVQDPKQREVLDRNRRIGVGHFGFASAVAKLGIKYSDSPNSQIVGDILADACDAVDQAAFDYARQLRIPIPVKLRTVAPTGTIAKLAGVSEGIHPIFAKHFLRRIRFSDLDPQQVATVEDYRARGYNVEPCVYNAKTSVVEIPTEDILVRSVADLGQDVGNIESAASLTLEQMISVQAMYQKDWADNSVSYTANVDPDDYTAEAVGEIILKFGGLIKGVTIFPELSRAQSPYERLTQEQYESYETTEVADSVDENCASGACPIK